MTDSGTPMPTPESVAPSPPPSAPPRRFGVFRSLRHRNYRLFFAGQTVSLIGTWITRVATSWLVYRLTGSVLLLGVVGFASQIPTLLLTPFSGVLVDRWNRHRIMVVTQVLSMLQSFALAGLAFAGIITVRDVILLQLLQGIINAFDTPARQAFVVEMVTDRGDLPNAIALNSSMVNASRVIGPSIGGIIIAAVGEAWCFLLDGASYIAVIASLLAMRVTPRALPTTNTPLIEELRAGFRYVKDFPPVRSALILLALVSTLGMPYSVLLPAVARGTLNGDSHTLGFLMTAAGIGALGGAFYLASRHSVNGLGGVIAIAACTFGGGLVLFGFSRNVILSLLVAPVVGGGMMVTMASTNTILQTIVEERFRGRVMAYYAMAFLGTTPIGSLLAGVVADRIGPTNTIILGGVACIAGGVWFALGLPKFRAHVRPIYIERGIISPRELGSDST